MTTKPKVVEKFDVIVLGSGAAGMTAAVVAATEGLDVCLLEKDTQVGGTTAWSGGQVWVPGTRVAREMGHSTDSPEAVRAYLSALVTGSERDPRMAAFLETAPKVVAYLTRHTQVCLRPVPHYPDYYPDCTGATLSGRVLEPESFDASALGSKLKWLRLPLPEFTLFNDMMVAREDVPCFRQPFKTLRSFRRASRLILRHVSEKLRYGRGTSLVLGNALVARLLASLLDANVTVATGVVVRSLNRRKNGSITGVELMDGSSMTTRIGVVLATGGFTHDRVRRRELLPSAMSDNSATFSGATGDGARLAQLVGGYFASATWENAFLTPVSQYIRADGSSAVFPHTVLDRAKPGLVAVDWKGERFVNESVSYHEFGRALLSHHDQENSVKAFAYLIADSNFVWKYGLGALKPMRINRRFLTSQGYLVEASSIAELGEKLALPVYAFAETIRRYNQFAEKGEDPMFGRGCNVYQRFLGDPEVEPNPCVAPIECSPFFAVKIEIGDLSSAAGLATDSLSRVLDVEGTPISGLYACGADARSVMEGSYPGPGITLGPAITFGYLAAMDMVARSKCR